MKTCGKRRRQRKGQEDHEIVHGENEFGMLDV